MGQRLPASADDDHEGHGRSPFEVICGSAASREPKLLFLIHPHSKRAIISGITANPDSAWVTQQDRNVTMEITDLGFTTPVMPLIEHDTKYTNEFDVVWSAEGTRVKRVGPRAIRAELGSQDRQRGFSW